MSKKFNKPAPNPKNQLIIYGRHPVLSALKNPRRQVFKLLCTQENAAELRAASPRLVPQIVERKEIDRLLSADAVHQGMALFCAELPPVALEDVLALAEDKENCHVLVLDQVTDPQNIGAIIRSAVAFNTLALIVQDKNSPAENGTIAKASAGMIEHLPICRVTNLARTLEQLKEAGFWTIGMDGHAQTTVSALKKSGKNAIVMGSEGKGMRRLVEENCDITIRLPINPKVESLNVSTAAAVVLYEFNRE